MIDGAVVTIDDTLHAPVDFLNTITLIAGIHDLDLVFFELGGGASIELFAATGTFGAFDASMRLVGDTANGGLTCNIPPPPLIPTLNAFSISLIILSLMFLGNIVLRRRI